MTRPLSNSCLQFLRPYLSPSLPATKKSIYIRFFNTTRCLARIVPSSQEYRGDAVHFGRKKSSKWSAEIDKDRAPIEARIEELRKGGALGYPRIQAVPNTMTVWEFQRQYANMEASEKMPLEMRHICGM